MKVSPAAPLGQRLAEFDVMVRPLACEGASEVLQLLAEARGLIDQRNALVHGCVLTKGRVIPNDPGKPEFHVTPETLTDLAERVSTGRSGSTLPCSVDSCLRFGAERPGPDQAMWPRAAGGTLSYCNAPR